MGIFKDGGPLIPHSLVLHFPRWRPSQISHPWHVQDVNAFSESNSRGLQDHCKIPVILREIENKGYAKFGGQIRCIMGNVEVAY